MQFFTMMGSRASNQWRSCASSGFRSAEGICGAGARALALTCVLTLVFFHSAHAQIGKARSDLRSIEAEKQRLVGIIDNADCIDVPDALDTDSPFLGEEAAVILKQITGSRKKLRDYEARLDQLKSISNRRRTVSGRVCARSGAVAIVCAGREYYALAADTRVGTPVDGRIEVDNGEVPFTDEYGLARDARRAHLVDATHEASELGKAQARLEAESSEVEKRCGEIRSIIARKAGNRSADIVKGLAREADSLAQAGKYREAFLCDSVVATLQPSEAARTRMQTSLSAYLAVEVRAAQDRNDPDAEIHALLRQLRETGDASMLENLPPAVRRQTTRLDTQMQQGRTSAVQTMTAVERLLGDIATSAGSTATLISHRSMQEARQVYRDLALKAMRRDLRGKAALIPSHVVRNDDGFLERRDGFGLCALTDIERRGHLLDVTREQLLQLLEVHDPDEGQVSLAALYLRRNSPPLIAEKTRFESWQHDVIFTLDEESYEHFLDADRDAHAERHAALAENEAKHVRDLCAQGYRAISGELGAVLLIDYHFEDIAWKQADPTSPMLVERMHVGGGRVQLQYTIRRFLFGVHGGYAQSFRREIYAARGSSTRNFTAQGMDGVRTLKLGLDVGYGVLHLVSGLMKTTGSHDYIFEGAPLSRAIDERGLYILAGLHFPYLQFNAGTVMPLDQSPKLYNKLGNSLFCITADVAFNLINFF